MFEKVLYLYGVTKQVSQTYLCGFCLMDIGPIACGLAFNGYDKETGKPKMTQKEDNQFTMVESTRVASGLKRSSSCVAFERLEKLVRRKREASWWT